MRKWIAKKVVKKRYQNAQKEQNKVAEFCGHLNIKSVNLYQSILKTCIYTFFKSKTRLIVYDSSSLFIVKLYFSIDPNDSAQNSGENRAHHKRLQQRNY